jgi:hypothetical protein
MPKPVIPDEASNDKPGARFIPKAALIAFTHPELGDVWIGAEENDMNDNIMVWDSLSTGMHAYEYEAGLAHIKRVISNVRKKHPGATVKTNYKGWR